MAVKIALLGELRLHVDGREVAITRPRLRSLLCALALRAGAVVPHDVLVARVWGERVPDRAKGGLHTLVNQLRGLIGPDLVRTTGNGYLLDVPAEAVDALRFQRLLDTAPITRPVLVEALSLWRGDLLGGEWSGHEEAAHLVERYLAAVERRVDIDLERGQHAELVPELQALTARFPLREPLWARLVTALYLSRRFAEALGAYHAVRALLADSLGTSPSVELRELHSLVLAADDDVPMRSDPVPPRQLPPDIADFTGREEQLAVLDQALTEHGPRRPPVIVAVHGPGGAGKTTLAVHWAHRVSDEFPDGQIHIDMRGYGPGEPVDPATALDIGLRALGVLAARVPQSLDERAALWRTTLFERRILLLIDNVRDAAQVRPLLPGAGGVVLVTSRNKLRGLAVRQSARWLGVGELPVDEAIALVTGLIGAERAAAEPEALVELVRLCSSLPLALVVAAHAAAQYPDAPIADLVADLRGAGRLDLLADADDPTADPRTVFSWSYHALATDTAKAFRTLGLHPTPRITLTTASVLLRTPIEDARHVLGALTAGHLLEQDRRGGYRFHDLLQVYARERAQAHDPAEDVHAVRHRILDWYLHTLCQARIAAFSPFPLEVGKAADEFVQPMRFPDLHTATAWYEQHRTALLAAVEYAAEHHFDRHCWQIAFLLRHFQESHGHVDDRLRAGELAVRSAERSGDELAIVYAAYTMGAAHYCAGQYAEAEDWLLRSVLLGRRIEAHAMTSTASATLGLTHARAGRMPDALRWLRRAVVTGKRSSSPVPLAHVLLNLSDIEAALGMAEDALAHSQQALRLYREVGSAYFEAFALGNMAGAALAGGRRAEALAYADQSLDLLGTLDDQITVPETLIVKGRILADLGQRRPARETWQRALRIYTRTNNPRASYVEGLLTD
ncbi:BTAD domain-containing putative transcriptional regulator [Kibdelosporangium lantanae]